MSHQTSVSDSLLASRVSRESVSLCSAFMVHESMIIALCSHLNGKSIPPCSGSQRWEFKKGRFKGCPEISVNEMKCSLPWESDSLAGKCSVQKPL